MIETFLAGCAVGAVAFLYTGPLHRYRNLVRAAHETRRERTIRALTGLAWGRAILLVLASGVFWVVMWHGLPDVLAAAAEVVPW